MIAPADVVVKVAACAINRLDLIQRNGHYTLPGYQLPHIAGMDVAGVIVEAGSDVDNVALGDRVLINPSLTRVRGNSRFVGLDDRYGKLGVIGGNIDGGYAEYCAAPASHVQPIPDAVSDDEAACIPTCFVTAWHALVETGALTAGETVLIHAAGGGVSSAAIQIARRLGATVLATARTEAKLAHARRLGAEHALCNQNADVAQWAHDVSGGRGVDMVFDHVGPALWQASLGALRPRGRLITCGATTGAAVTLELGRLHLMGIRIIGSDSYTYDEFQRALELYWRGGFQQSIDSSFPLAAAGEAQRRMDSPEVIGKVLLKP
jgi:NADPH:quinone reductase-like Zn-dependent oxidoreductase